MKYARSVMAKEEYVTGITMPSMCGDIKPSGIQRRVIATASAMCSTLTKWKSLSIVLLFFAQASVAQITQSARYEFALGHEDANFEIITAHQNGLFLLRRLLTDTDQDQLEITKLDTAFVQSWQGYLPFDKRYLLVGKYTDSTQIHFLFRYKDYTRNDLELIVMEQNTGKFVHHLIKNLIP